MVEQGDPMFLKCHFEAFRVDSTWIEIDSCNRLLQYEIHVVFNNSIQFV